jgi:plastocyanin
MRQIVSFVLALVAICSITGPAYSQGWGNLKGRFVYDGKAPAPQPITPTKDQEVCGKTKLVDESLLVGANGGLQNVVVFISVGPGDKAPAVHPDLKKAASEPVVFDNAQCRFSPHIALVQTGQTVNLTNSDSVAHNTKVDAFNQPINPLLPPGAKLAQKFTAEERLPAKASCSIHPWMTGWLVIKSHPYMAVTDENGEFEIKNIPAGTWTFQFWHEKAGYLDSVTVNNKATTWKRGRVDLDVKDKASLNLGDVKVAASAFEG